MKIFAVIFSLLPLLAADGLRGDQIEMRNGDRYIGKVLSMTESNLVLQSEMLGRVTVARAKVANITLGSVAVASSATRSTNQHHAASIYVTNSHPDISAALQGLGGNTNFIEQVRQQFLADAGPQANAKFDELVTGLMNGQLDINGLRAQAKTAEDQIRSLKQGGGVGDALDSYLAVLDKFLSETDPATHPATLTPPSTNAPSATTVAP